MLPGQGELKGLIAAAATVLPGAGKPAPVLAAETNIESLRDVFDTAGKDPWSTGFVPGPAPGAAPAGEAIPHRF